MSTTSRPHTIVQHHLTRLNVGPFHEHTYSFMNPFLPGTVAPTWSSHLIAKHADGTDVLHEYLVSPESQAYIIATAFLREEGKPEDRRTDMRLSDMVVDSFLAAGGKAGDLRFLGINWIVNQGALWSIHRAFQDAAGDAVRTEVIDGEQVQVFTLDPSSWEGKSDNVFVGCAQRVARALSGAAGVEVVLKGVSLIRTKAYVHHMVCEFEQQEAEPVKKTSLLKRTFSRKGRDAIKRTLSRLVVRR